MYSEIKEQKIRQEFSRLKSTCYLDHVGATLYSERQIEAVSKDLCSNVYGNPHSLSLSSHYTSDLIDQVRYRILQHFKTDSQEYSVLFTSGATASLKLVAECFDWSGEHNEKIIHASNNSNVKKSKDLQNGISKVFSHDEENLRQTEVTNDVGQKYTGVAGDFLYLQDNHTSVLGMRTLAAGRCESTHCLSNAEAFEAFALGDPKFQHVKDIAYEGNSLFVYPAQSNFSGVKYPLSWVSQTQDGCLKTVISRKSSENKMCVKHSKWFCMLDAASYVSTNSLDLSQVKPDFVCVSFYKLFGYPTGLGALLVRNTSAYVLHKRYFGGGTVLIALSCEKFHVPRPLLSDRFEDGTLPFLSIASLQHGFDTIARLAGDMENVAEHTFALAQQLFNSLLTLHHYNGTPVAILYCDTDYQDLSTQGAIVNFNLLRANKEYVGFVEVMNMANLQGIQLRTGCFCNPGACQRHLGLSSQDIRHHFQAGHVCGDDKDLVDGKPTGSVRVSFGYMSCRDDVDKLLSLIMNCFVEKPAINKTPEWWFSHVNMYRSKFLKVECIVQEQWNANCESNLQCKGVAQSHCDIPSRNDAFQSDLTVVSQRKDEAERSATQAEYITLTHLFLYPVKSCAALPVSSWTIGPRGLIYDREWMVVSSSGVCLTQKQETRLCLIRPTISFETNQLFLDYPGMTRVSVPLDLKVDANKCQSKICRDRVQAVDCGDEVACWLAEALFRDGVRLMKQIDSDSRFFSYDGSGQKYSLSLSNQAQFLLLSRRTIDWLGEQIDDTSDCSKESLLHRFRSNLVVCGNQPFEENDWKCIQIGDAIFKSAGLCTRCQMICIDQSTGEKTVEPLRTLAACLQGKMRFGVYFTHQHTINSSSNIRVGARVKIL